MTTITWKDRAEKTCVLEITDGNSGITELTAGANPFVTSIDETDDIFQPIRGCTGNIGVKIDSVDDIVSLVGRTPISTPVMLTVNDNIRWVGFLSCESFSQEWDKGPLDIDLPVMSGLEVIKGMRYPYTGLSDLGYINFAQFIVNMNTALGNMYTAFYFPNISNPGVTLKYKFRMSNYATPDDKNTTYEMATYYDILEDICKLFGWQVVEYHSYLVFMAADVKSLNGQSSNCLGWNSTQFARLAAGQTATSSGVTFSTIVPEFFGVDHRRSFVAGANKVDVVGNLNEIADDIWSMDVVAQCVYKGHNSFSPNLQSYSIKKFASYQADGLSYPNGNIVASNSMAGGVDVQNGYNIKYANFYAPSTGAYGGSIAYEKFYKFTNTHEITEGDRDFVMRLITKGINTNLYVAHTIRTNYYYTPNQNTTDKFYIRGDVKVANAADDVFDAPTGTTYCRAVFKIGDYYYNGSAWTTTAASLILSIRDGEIDGYGHTTGSGVVFTADIPAPSSVSGEVVLQLMATTLGHSNYGPGDEYVAYENLKIQLVTANSRRSGVYIESSNIRSDINENKTNLNNGFTDEWTQNCGLTLAREDVVDCNGVVLKSDLTLPDSLYSSKYPEKALCDRVSAYAAQARMVLYAVVKGEGELLSPLKCYAMESGGRPWICLCQKMNWKNNEITAGFFEPSYNS